MTGASTTGRSWLRALKPADDVAAAVWLARSWALFGGLLFAVTWRLWTPQTLYPQVPLVALLGLLPAWCEWLALGAVTVGLIGAGFWPRSRVGRWSAILFATTASLMICVDQHRLQPWAYQLIVLAVILSTDAPHAKLRLSRILLISIYFFSALSKFDYLFVHTLGQQFLATLLGLVGVSPEGWRPAARLALAGLFPCGELLVAVGLAWPRARRRAVVGAIALHALLLLILGPWGLDHHQAVLVWNLFFASQIWILFGARRQPDADEVPPETGRGRARAAGTSIVSAGVWVVALLPALEPWGWLDHWPSWQLYAPRNSRVQLLIDETAAARLPPDLRSFLREPNFDLQRRLDLGNWSLEALSVPIYPQDRFQLGVALAVIRQFQLEQASQVRVQGVASRTTGRRPERTISGTETHAWARDQYWLNALPRRWPRGAPPY